MADVAPRPDGTIRERIRSWVGGPLAPELREDFSRDVAEGNHRRLAVLLPLMTVVHVIHVALFWTFAPVRSALPAATLAWRDGLVLTHAGTAALALVLSLVARFKLSRRGAQVLSFASVTLYLVHGAVISGVDQLKVPNVNAFVSYCLGCVVIVCFTWRVALALYAIGLASFVLAMQTLQPDPAIRLAMLPNGGSISVVCIALSTLIYAARRRDFVQRSTIVEQREALRALNVGLEERVQEQVSKIMAHTEEVERLNAQLQAQVRERSAELSIALEKLARARPFDATLPRGLVLGERFEIEELLAEGGMGAVYAGLDRQTKSRVAIKVIQAHSSRQLDALRRFLREARATARVTHPAVVRMFHVDVSDDGMLFHALELVQGVTLHELLKDGKPWEARVVARLGSVLCEALAAAHAEGIVHRDVKPGNIMLTHVSPGLKLLDFGISKLFDDPAMASDHTETGVVLGTPAYMGPEQSDRSQVTARVDVYATGVILFLMLTGHHPFDRTPSGSMRVPSSQPNLRVSSVTIPEDLAAIINPCLERDPTKRPEAKDLAASLAAFADAQGAPALADLALATRAKAPPAPAVNADLVATLAERKRASRPG